MKSKEGRGKKPLPLLFLFVVIKTIATDKRYFHEHDKMPKIHSAAEKNANCK